jgi:hypothetical protein
MIRKRLDKERWTSWIAWSQLVAQMDLATISPRRWMTWRVGQWVPQTELTSSLNSVFNKSQGWKVERILLLIRTSSHPITWILVSVLWILDWLKSGMASAKENKVLETLMVATINNKWAILWEDLVVEAVLPWTKGDWGWTRVWEEAHHKMKMSLKMLVELLTRI